MEMAASANEVVIEQDSTQSLLHKNSSHKQRKWIIIGFTLTAIISALISSLATYAIVKNGSDEMEIDIVNHYDIAIIGAGSAGLIQAHFLSKHYPNSKIIVLEQLSRFGGRQWTSFIHKIDENNHKMNSIHFENGAMRFESYHSLVLKLLSYLNLCNDIMPMSFGANISVASQQIYQYRNHRITGKELFGMNESETRNYFSSAFNVNQKYIPYLDGNAESIWRPIYDRILSQNSNGTEPVTERDWFRFRNNYTFNGEYLFNYGESIALRVIGNYSREVLNYMYRSNTEQKMDTSSRNLAMLLYERFNKLQYSANYTNKTNRWTLKNGYGSMNNALYQSMNNSSTDIVFNNKVSAIGKRQNKYLIESNFGQYYYSANNVILSIPPDKVLQLLPYSPILNTEKFHKILDSFVWDNNVKINLIYDSSVLMQQHLEAMVPSSSDLEIRQFLIENAWTNGTLTALCIYTTGKDNAFWYSAQLIGEKYPINETLSIDDNEALQAHIASVALVEEIVRQMQELTQVLIPMPLAAFMNVMGVDMETSGVSRFKTTVNADEVINESYNPIDDEDIFMAVSDYAWQYGWMESSISAAMSNLKRNFDIQTLLVNEPMCEFP